MLLECKSEISGESRAASENITAGIDTTLTSSTFPPSSTPSAFDTTIKDAAKVNYVLFF